jgi:hypothetical protein
MNDTIKLMALKSAMQERVAAVDTVALQTAETLVTVGMLAHRPILVAALAVWLDEALRALPGARRRHQVEACTLGAEQFVEVLAGNGHAPTLVA